MTDNENHDIPSCKDFLAKMGPIETLLGSLSYNEIDNADGKTQQLRTSARVFKKMKFDLSHNAALEKKDKKDEIKPEEIKQEIKKSVNPLWSSEEKKMFFEALNEYGKDFESIHMYICTRLKKRGVPDDQLKTKHQIRHFYYKTFHLVCGNLKFHEKIPKNVQELYSLINYGEMRKKVGSVPKKNLSKIGELVANGSVPVKFRGKTVKIKTPMCRALRRLNQLDEKYDDLKLPTRVLVELRPKDMVTFLKIQSMAQNPRIKVFLSLQKRLSSLITCINTRWKSTEAVVYDKAVISVNPHTKDCVPDEKTIRENSLLLTPLLRLAPPLDAHVELPSIDISEYFTGQSISLTAFEMRKGVKTKEEVKKEEPETTVVKTEKSPSKVTDENTTCESTKPRTSVTKVVNEAVNTILSLQTQDVHNKCDNKSDVKTKQEVSLQEKQNRIAQIREGWTVENCGSLTIGELYLMFGTDSKLVLEYSWDPLRIKSQEEELKNEDSKEENDLTTCLKKLLSLAKLHCNKTVMKCNCGHVCGSTKNTPQFKKPLTTKVVRKTQSNHENTTIEEKSEDTNVTQRVLLEPKTEELQNDDQFLNANSSVVQLFNQRETTQRLNSRIRTRGRGRCRQLVVERKLVPNKLETEHEIVTMNIVSQDNTPSEESVNTGNSNNLLKNSGLPSLLLSSSNKLEEDSSLSNKSFSGLLDDSHNSNISSGISKILNESEHQWISSDVADYSLSSLLGHLDCPTKTNDDTQISQLSQDVDAQLSTLLIETSVDYTAKFADLAAQVVDNKK